MSIELFIIAGLLVASLFVVRQLSSTAPVRERLRSARLNQRGAQRLNGR
jgi:hypothetical protein